MAGILTRCAACLVEIPHTAPRCGRCHTRYCGEACQREHWKQEPTHPWSTGPHEKFCKTIKKAGGAEQHYANQKYAQAVKTAEDCCDTSTKDNGPKAAKNKNLKYVVGETPVDDTSAAIRTQLKIDGHTGLTCHVCRKGGKLVRMCACSGKNGFAHIACLEKKAAKSVEDAVNKRGPRAPHSEQSWARWNACPLCGAEYVGQLSNALGWACWRTYCPVWKSNCRDASRVEAINATPARRRAPDSPIDFHTGTAGGPMKRTGSCVLMLLGFWRAACTARSGTRRRIACFERGWGCIEGAS